MKFNVLTLFPEMFSGPMSESILKRAQEKKTIELNYYNIRDYTEDKHKTVDDTPYGGGKGMVLKVDVLDRAISGVKRQSKNGSTRTILLTPQGEKFTQAKAIELSIYDNLILICGHYEGFDERIREHLIDEEISIGDFVLTGGELPAMCVIDATARMVPGVLAEGSTEEETFMKKDDNGKYIKEYPQYTRPLEYKGWKVPDVLISGNHAEIKKWRLDEANKRTG